MSREIDRLKRENYLESLGFKRLKEGFQKELTHHFGDSTEFYQSESETSYSSIKHDDINSFSDFDSFKKFIDRQDYILNARYEISKGVREMPEGIKYGVAPGYNGCVCGPPLSLAMVDEDGNLFDYEEYLFGNKIECL